MAERTSAGILLYRWSEVSSADGRLEVLLAHPGGPFFAKRDLGSIVQKGGKVVHAGAIQGDLDPAEARSNMFEIVWPPRSGKRESFPEIDRVAWFAPDEARRRIKPTQVPLIDRLEAALDGRAGSSR